MKTQLPRASTRILWVVIPLLLAGVAAGAYGVRSYAVQAIYASYEASLRDELVTVEQALVQAFMDNDPSSVQQIVSNLSFHGQTDVIRILRQDGSILASSIPAETGVRLDLQGPECLPCHSGQNVQAPALKQIPADREGRKIVITAEALDNQIACQSCHSEDEASLGVILADNATAPIDARAARLTQGIYAGAAVLFVLLASAFQFSLNRMVSRPLQLLVEGEAGGTFPGRQDEFGSLAHSLQEKSAQLDAQRRSFNALLTLSESIDVTLTAVKVLQFAIGKVEEMTGFSAIAMRLFEAKSSCFRLVAQRGMSPRMVEELGCIPAEIGFTGEVYKTHRAAYTSELQADQRLESPAPVEMGFRSLISVPLLSGERLMGSMELATQEAHIWREDEVRWLELMGRSIGSVLHHIQTSSELQDMAIMQERSRIAQEIHDGLVQLIGTLRIWAEEAQLSLGQNNLPVVREDLEKIELAARDAYASLREEILGLRETISPGRGIIPVMREFLNRYQRQWGIETRLLLIGGLEEDQGSSWISPAAEVQLLRILQEGLTNVRRHANATRVEVSIQDGGEHLQVEIRDNGRGFEPQDVPEEKFGLRIMRERAAGLGGNVRVDSHAGQGTRLIVELPKETLPFPGQRP